MSTGPQNRKLLTTARRACRVLRDNSPSRLCMSLGKSGDVYSTHTRGRRATPRAKWPCFSIGHKKAQFALGNF